uniref:Arginine Nmethyltransferase putative n=1 Tax=Albugo laibachii Nc14 TaxID=890382 RepID=F0WE86_9STRA|nr:arginine Nmethyltransferase putative [Albugo laibachii Nc14]|eukprot:CCA19515.1 arginine Nmethyltransferase putative [Albugo laibachii Nc14]
MADDTPLNSSLDMDQGTKSAWEKSSDFANYFCTYGYVYHQKQMLSDDLRMQCYRDAIFENPSHFKDKVILDVGTGSGILAIWAAQAGATKVYAVEATDIALQARKLVKANDQEDVVTIIQSKIEDVTLPEKVDVIISEWMGYFLLRESMLDSVLVARDRWLKPDGSLFPSHASMCIAPACNEDNSNKRYAEFTSAMDDWRRLVDNTKSTWGVDMSVLGSAFRKEQDQYSLRTSAWAEVTPEELIGDEVEIASWDLLECTIDDVKQVQASFEFQFQSTTRFGGIVGWFEVDFRGSPSHPATHAVNLSTSPFVQPTHWGQQVFSISPPTQVCEGDRVEGTVTVVRRSDNQRLMNVKFEYRLQLQDDSMQNSEAQDKVCRTFLIE